MNTKTLLLASGIALCSLIALGSCEWPALAATPGYAPTYTADGRLELPANYREWVYLTSGFDMSYNPRMQMDHHMFDNVFVEPSAYKAFQQTGTWPDKTVLVLEARAAKDKGSINKSGNFQSTEIMGTEVHVKDTARFEGGWAFFGFDSAQPAKMVPTSEDCYACHAKHAAVDMTFVQFYPTLLPIAAAKGTFAAGYKQDLASATDKP
jgi:hypothetical protein